MGSSVKCGLCSLIPSFIVCFVFDIELRYAFAFSIILTFALLIILPVICVIFSRIHKKRIRILKSEFGEEYPVKNVTVWDKNKKGGYRCFMGISKERLVAVRRSKKHPDVVKLEKAMHKEIVMYGEWFIIRLSDKEQHFFAFKCRRRFRVLKELVMSGWNVSAMKSILDMEDDDDSSDDGIK